jgi:pantetheine-phosphate adenylyltransferase
MTSTDNQRIAVYPGSFDPITYGHLDIIKRALRIFDHVRIGVGINPRKIGIFSTDERAELIKQACEEDDLSPDAIHIDAFKGLVYEYAEQAGACAIVRGLRALTDFEFEQQFAHVIKRLHPNIEPVFMMTAESNAYVSSSLVKELAQNGADISSFVPACVEEALKKKLEK